MVRLYQALWEVKEVVNWPAHELVALLLAGVEELVLGLEELEERFFGP